MALAFVCEDSHGVGVSAESCTLLAQAVHYDHVQVLALEFAESILLLVIGFKGKTYEALTGTFALA